MRIARIALALAILLTTAAPCAPAADCCGPGGCSTCKPKWEDKKTKTPKYSQKCSDECVRGRDAWCDHGCCPEDTPPVANIFTRKKLFKKDEEKVERILKYELVNSPSQPCQPACQDCRPAWYDVHGLFCCCLPRIVSTKETQRHE
jgi:hypothetical protein